jgi:class 3 adenylate cyclase
MQQRQAALVLADISGYTQFVNHHDVAVLHAEQIITDLLEAVIDSAEFPLTLSKLEGDAVFMYADASGADPHAVAKDVTRQVLAFFEAFKIKMEQFSRATTCPCDACQHVSALRLKAMLHFGDVIVKRIRQFEELAGPDVILVHRLLKNHVPSNEYILMTRRFYDLSGGLPGGEEMEARSEEYDQIGTVPVLVRYVSLPEAVDVPALTGWERLKLGIKYTWLVVQSKLGVKGRPEFVNLPE